METLPLSVFNRLCSVLLQKGVWFCSLLKSNYAWVGMWFSKVLRGRHKSHFPQNETTMTTTKQGTKRDMMIQCVHQSVCVRSTAALNNNTKSKSFGSIFLAVGKILQSVPGLLDCLPDALCAINTLYAQSSKAGGWDKRDGIETMFKNKKDGNSSTCYPSYYGQTLLTFCSLLLCTLQFWIKRTPQKQTHKENMEYFYTL